MPRPLLKSATTISTVSRKARFVPLTPWWTLCGVFHGQLPLAVATGSTQASAEASLRGIGILNWFDAVVSSHDIGHPKPAPDVFLVAAKRIAVAPADCVAFEDGEAGLQAAREAGMHAVDIRPWLPPRDKE